MKLTQKIDRMANEIDTLRKQKDKADNLVQERLNQIRQFESTNVVNSQQIQKWQFDMDKLTKELTIGEQKV